jgi:hypothetical protein
MTIGTSRHVNYSAMAMSVCEAVQCGNQHTTRLFLKNYWSQISQHSALFFV